MLYEIQGAAAAAANALLRGSLDQYVDLEGADSEHALYTSGGSLISLFEWRGVRSMMDAEEMSEAAGRLRERLAGWLENPGRALQIVYARDPLGAARQVQAATATVEAQMRAQRLDLLDVIAGRRRELAASGAAETVLIALYTHPSALDAGSRAQARAALRAGLAGIPPVRDAQVPGRVADQLRQIHNALAESLPGDFRRAGQEIRLMPAAEAAEAVSAAIAPSADGIRPRLAGRRPAGQPIRTFRTPDTRAGLTGADYSALGAERLSWQLLRDHAELLDGGIVRIGNTIALPFDLAAVPETLTPHSRLIASIADSDEPLRWRISFLLESGGWAGTAFKRLYAIFFAFLNRTHNTRIRDAFQELESLDGAEETLVRLRVCAACWDETGSEDRLRRSVSRLRQAVERWGNARTDALAGDPVACYFGSAPGAGSAPTAPAATAPLTDALALLPLNRPCSPWDSGPLPLAADYGRLWPYRPGSALQDSWCDLISGSPGTGKSMLLNAMNAAAFLTGAGRDDPRPLLGIIDIGAGSAGLAGMIREALPAERRPEAVIARLRNAADYAVNIFDTPTGCRRPTALGRTFLVNFVRLLLDDGSSGIGGLIGLAVDQAFAAVNDAAQPKRWNAGQIPEVDRQLAETGWQGDERATWWECVDTLSDAGRWDAAASAQRLAVPVMADLAAAAAEPRIADIYSGMKLKSGEPALAGLRRVVAEAVSDWPLLAHPTAFDMGGATLRAIDLQDVTSRSSERLAQRNAALMYMLARHVCTQEFYLAPEDVPGLRLRDSQHQRMTRLAGLARRTPKRLSIDEFHRVGGLPGIIDQIETDVREGRKHNVQIALASQMLSDFGPRLTGLASGIWMCGASAPEIRLAREELNLDSAGCHALRRRLTGPGPAGAPVFAALTVKGGNVRQLLTHRLGAGELWAYSTTAEDVALRDELTALLGPAAARHALAAAWPAGTARKEIQRRAELAAARGDAGQTISEMAAEIAARWRAAA